MQRAIEHQPASSWPAASAAGTVTLDYDARHRRRIRITTDAGEDVLLDLPKAVPMADGDGLMLQDGRWLLVAAAPEDLVEVRTSDATKLARIGWHLGNRHLPAEIGDGVIRIRPDHVIQAMLARFGAEVTPISAPFQPEGGAYSGEPPHPEGHDHRHGHGQGDADGHDHRTPGHSHSHPHDHDY
jgi:urease accessory protein